MPPPRWIVRRAAPRPCGDLAPEQMRGAGMVRISWWGLPARNTLDRAHRAAPGAARGAHRGDGHRPRDPLPDVRARFRRSRRTAISARRSCARSTPSIRRRSATTPRCSRPVGIIPMHTPDEAIAELEFATVAARAEGVHVRRPDRPAGARPRRAARGWRAGSTRSVSTASTTTTRCGPSAWSSACHPRSTPRRWVGRRTAR